MKKVLLSALAVSVMFVSCDKDSNNPTPNPGAQTQLGEVFGKIADIQDNMYEKSSSELLGVFNSFKSDVASSATSDIASWIKHIKPEGEASNGTAGKLGKRYLNEHGLENGQLVKKGLIGAFQLNQALAYGQKLAKSGLTKQEQQEILVGFATALLGDYASVDNDKIEMESHGKTFMGYPVKKGNEFAKYANVVNNDEDFAGISDELYNSLKEAKKNLGDQSVVTRNVMKALATAQKIVAIRGVHYLKEASELGGDELNDGVAHGISEGLGFLYSLQFTYNPESHRPYMSRSEVMELLNNLNLWNADESKAKLEAASKKIAEKLGFEWTEA